MLARSGWSNASADRIVVPARSLAKICTHWLRRLPIWSEPGVIKGFIWIGTRI